MNALIVPSWYPRKRDPGVGIFFRDYALMMQKMGINVYVADIGLLPNRDLVGNHIFRIYRYVDEGITVYKYKIPSILGLRNDIIEERITRNNLKKILNKLRKDGVTIDVVHAHAFRYAGLVCTRTCKRIGIPVVLTEHSSDILNRINRTKHFRLFAKEAYSQADVVTAVSKKLSTIIEEDYDVVCKWIPNCYDEQQFEYKKANKYDYFTFICVGNLIPGKRVSLLIDAFNEIHRQYKKTKLIVIGDGCEMALIQHKVEIFDLQEAVSLLGYQTKDKISQILSKSHCFVLPSAFETFGIAYIEAMAMGLPVIATRCGGPECFVFEYNGVLIDVDDIYGLEKAMDYMINNIDKYDSSIISSFAKTEFGERAIGSRILEIYSRLQKDKRNEAQNQD